MKYVKSIESITVPENVDVSIRSRRVKVTGPRGTLTKDLSHIAVTFTVISKQVIQVRCRRPQTRAKKRDIWLQKTLLPPTRRTRAPQRQRQHHTNQERNLRC